MSKRLAINIGLSLAMLVLCVWLVWPSPAHKQQIKDAWYSLELSAFFPYLLAYIGLLAVTHFCRMWRWNYLLHPIGVHLTTMRLFAVSSVGFMAILALPARLGEFVRPALVRKRGEVSMAAALGTIAVERISDGLLISVVVFVLFFTHSGPYSPDWMMPVAYAAIGVFLAAMGFLAFALKWPDKTIATMVKFSLIRRFSPRVADRVAEKLRALISGFEVLGDRKNYAIFFLWTALYWLFNSVGMLVLARGFGLELSFLGAFATTGLVAVGITLPNAPALVGQYQWLVTSGLALYLGPTVAKTDGFLFAVFCHGIQVLWYVGWGVLSMSSKHVSFTEVVASRKVPDDSEDE
jgi:hypothetical protein